ncbi:MAG: DUF5018 domain-containing protein, partial [Bacteroidetes bacterium]|nr:DUF5018 domain-containing protein [Bacteroidota bacterium]
MKKNLRNLCMLRHSALQHAWLMLSAVILLAGLPLNTFAQIYEPDGLRMPGDWNGWTNNLDMGGPFDFNKMNEGVARWQTTFNYTGITGDQLFKFTSTNGGNNWANQWSGNASVSLNALNNFQFGDHGNNSISVTNGKWYAVVFEDAGYANTRAIFMETSAEPVDLLSLTVPADIVQNESADITLTLSASASAEEIFYLRYSTDNWSTSALTTFSMTGSSGTATIPGQDAGKTVSYYAFSSTVSGITADFDLYTIELNNNGGSNYSYAVAGLSSDAEILSFSLAEQTGAAVINSAAATVAIEVANGTDLSSLTPTITVSAGASVDPASGVAQNFSAPVDYTVTAEDNTEKVWTVTVTEAEIVIGWVNLQWPENGNITTADAFNVYAQVYAAGVTDQAGQGAGISAWIGYSTEDTDPSTWTNWVVAGYNSDQGNNDEYTADLGAAISTAGTYYYASRFQPNGGDFVYGGFSGGFWDGTNNVSGVLTVTEPVAIELSLPYANALRTTPQYDQLIADGFVVDNASHTTAASGYLRIYNGGFLETPLIDFTAYGLLQISFSSTTYGGVTGQTLAIEISEDSGENYAELENYVITGSYLTYEYIVDLSAYPSENGMLRIKMISGTNSTRFRDLSLQETFPDPEIGFANLQWPASGSIEPLQEFNVYAQAWIDGITGSGSATADLQAWIGYSTTDTDPSTWTNWVAADFSSAQGNNDEFVLDLGAEMATEGTFYYASRFKYLEQDYVYGGFDGGFWDGVDNVSGVLTVSATPPDPEITFANLQHPESASILIGGSVEVYAQVEATGVDLSDTGYEGLTVWIGYSDTDTDPAGWTNWTLADYNGISGFTSRPEYLGEIGSDITAAGTYYYASRFQLDGGTFVYGG